MFGSRLPVPAPWQAPQFAHGKDEGEHRGYTEHDQGPDEEEASAGSGDAARDADTLPHHVDDRDAHTKERSKEDDDVP